MLFFAFYNKLSTPDSYDHFVEIDRPAHRIPSQGQIFVLNIDIKHIQYTVHHSTFRGLHIQFNCHYNKITYDFYHNNQHYNTHKY